MEERDDVRTLEISKVTMQDAGLYRITIDNDLGREQATARLDVISKLEFSIIPEGFLPSSCLESGTPVMVIQCFATLSASILPSA